MYFALNCIGFKSWAVLYSIKYKFHYQCVNKDKIAHTMEAIKLQKWFIWEKSRSTFFFPLLNPKSPFNLPSIQQIL